MGKLSLSEVKPLSQCHSAAKWQSLDSKTSLLVLSPGLLLISLFLGVEKSTWKERQRFLCYPELSGLKVCSKKLMQSEEFIFP